MSPAHNVPAPDGVHVPPRADSGTSPGVPPVSGAFMAAYAFAQYAAWFAIMGPVVLTIALRVSQVASPEQKGYFLSSILAVGAFGALAAAPIWGAISDRTRFRIGKRKPYLVLGPVLLLAGLLTLALSESLVGLVLGWLVCQVGSNAHQAALNALLPDLVPDHQRGIMSALLGLTINVAIVSAVFVTQYTSASTLQMFLVPWILLPIAIGLLLMTFKDRPAGEMPAFSGRVLLSTFWVNPLKHPDFGWAFLSRFLIFLAAAFFLSYQLYFLTDFIRIPQDEVLELIFEITLVTTVIIVVVTPLAGWLSDRIGRRKPLVFGAALVVAGGLLSLSQSTTVTQFLISAAIYGAGVAVYYAVDIALCVAVLPNPEDSAKDMGVIQIANSLPQSIAPAIAPIFLAIGAGGSNYPAVFIAAAAFGVAGAIVILPIRSSR